MLVADTNMGGPLPKTWTYFSPNTRNPDCTLLPPPLHDAKKAQHTKTIKNRTSFVFFIAVSSFSVLCRVCSAVLPAVAACQGDSSMRTPSESPGEPLPFEPN